MTNPNEAAGASAAEPIDDSAAQTGQGQEGGNEAANGEGEGEQPKPKSRIQERISELVNQRTQAQQEAETLRRELAAERAGRQQGREAPAGDDNDEGPSPDVREVIRAELQAEREQQTYAQTVTSLQQRLMDSGLEGAVLVASGDHSIPFNRQMLEIAAELPEAPQIADYLGKNPAEARRISTLPPHKMGVAMAGLAVKVKAAPAVSKALEPVSGIKTSVTPSGGPSDSMSVGDWMKARKAELSAKR